MIGIVALSGMVDSLVALSGMVDSSAVDMAGSLMSVGMVVGLMCNVTVGLMATGLVLVDAKHLLGDIVGDY